MSYSEVLVYITTPVLARLWIPVAQLDNIGTILVLQPRFFTLWIWYICTMYLVWYSYRSRRNNRMIPHHADCGHGVR